MRCIALTAPLAILAIVFFMGLAPSHTWIATETPVVAGWIALALACRWSGQLREAVRAGRTTTRRARWMMLPLIPLFPLVIAMASALGLAMTDALRIHRGHMTGLQPYVFGFGALIVAIVAWGVHAWSVRSVPRTPS